MSSNFFSQTGTRIGGNATRPAVGGQQAPAESTYNMEELGDVPRLSAPANAPRGIGAPAGNNNNSSNMWVNNHYANSPYTQPLVNQTAYDSQFNGTTGGANLPPSNYVTTVNDDGENGEAEEGHQEGCIQRWVNQIKEVSKLEGRTPLCKALTYINFALAFFIFYLVIKAF